MPSHPPRLPLFLRHAWQPSVVAIALIAAAAALRLWPLQALGVRLAWLTFYPAVAVAALYGGFSAGLLGTVLSCLTLLYLWPVLGDRPFIQDSADWLGLAVFSVTCVMISFVAEAMHRARTRAEQAKEQLEAANIKLQEEIDERKRAEEELSSQTRILKSVLTSIGEGVVVADLNGKFLIWNPAAERIIQLGPVDVSPEQWTKQYGVYLPDQVTPYPADQLPLARAIRGESMDGDEQFLRHAKAPQGIWLSVTGRPLRDEFGVLQGGVVAISDITERKQTEEAIKRLNTRLELANKELEAFSYSVSHDLRAPLRALDGFSQALLEDYADALDEKGKDHLQRVRAASQRMARLIDDMLNLSRVTRSEMQVEPVDLSSLAKTIAAELQAQFPDRHVALVIRDGITATGDGRLLRQVLDNLLGNAWKFTSKRPAAAIEFGVTATDGRPVYFVRDDGAGFDMAYAGKLFSAFQRLHAAAEFPGTGIGLATVQRIIHRHGGRVWAESTVGEGATFYFTL
jgi:signal transduction histidine kinase